MHSFVHCSAIKVWNEILMYHTIMHMQVIQKGVHSAIVEKGVYFGSCSARCPYPTMGDFKAFATAAHVSGGLPLLNQSLIMGVTQRSGLSLPAKLIESSVPDDVPSFNPMLYHRALASQTASSTSPRSLMVSCPA